MSGNTAKTDLTALTIAGFDPSSGAGITADLAVFAAHRIFGTSAITALTVQSTTGVRRVQPIDAALLRQTLDCLAEDLPPAGIKIGMLGGAEQVAAVADFIATLQTVRRPAIVLDPVIRSSSGAALLSEEGVKLLRERLLPLVDCVTPNTDELTALTGMNCASDNAIEVAAQSLAAQYPGLTVLATGGHRPQPDDLLLHDGVFTLLRGERIETRATHGTGCALSSALLCGLLQGLSYADAASAAKAYVAQAIRTATPLGQGKGPMNLLWPMSSR